MRPILWQWGRVRLHSYTFFLYLGLLFGTFAGHAAARSGGLDARRVVLATLLLLVPALVGARLLFVASHWPLYRRDPRRIWRRSEGGASLYGGLLLAVPISWPLLRMLGLPVAAFWDVASFTMLVGLAFTRVGCLLNGCCGGRPTASRFSVHLPDAHGVWARRVPVQLIELGLALVLLSAATVAWEREQLAGALFLQVMIVYALARLLLDPWRQRDGVEGAARASSHEGLLGVPLVVLAGFSRWT